MPSKEPLSTLNEERNRRLRAEAKVTQLEAQLEIAIEQAGTCELNLVESDRLAALGLLTAGIAHELNNPLGYVSSNVSSLREYLEEFELHIKAAQTCLEDLKHPDGLTDTPLAKLRDIFDNKVSFLLEDAADLLADTVEGTRRMEGIVGGLRDYSRYDDGWDMANMVDCLKSTIKIAQNEFKNGCTLVEELSELPESYFNNGKLAQVFLNLLMNAGHAVGEDGCIKVNCVQRGSSAVIEVVDDGCGIANEDLDHIFEPFFTTKPRGLGTGLGLSISRSIVEEHGGNLTATSQVGCGTAFCLELPLRMHLPATNTYSANEINDGSRSRAR